MLAALVDLNRTSARIGRCGVRCCAEDGFRDSAILHLFVKQGGIERVSTRGADAKKPKQSDTGTKLLLLLFPFAFLFCFPPFAFSDAAA